jgi:alanine dehydrogenase
MIVGVPREIKGVTHCCVANMPGAYARTATQALTNVTYPYVELLADHGLADACRRDPTILGSINLARGQITHPAVAEAHGTVAVSAESLLA